MIELDFFKIKNHYRRENILKIVEILRDIGAYNHLFLSTHNSFSISTEIIKYWNLDIGYLISNSGSVIYNLVSKDKMGERFLKKELILIIIKSGIFHNLGFVLHTSSGLSFAYGIKYFTFSRYQGLHYQYKLIFSRFVRLSRWCEIKQVVEEYQIYNIEFFFSEFQARLCKGKICDFLDSISVILPEIQYFISGSIVYIYPRENLKIHSIKEVLRLNEMNDISKNLMYISLSQVDIKLAEISYFWFALPEAIENALDLQSISKVIYLPEDEIGWVSWLKENRYLWSYNEVEFWKKMRRIKYLFLENCVLLGQDNNSNSFYLNLHTGVLSNQKQEKEKRFLLRKFRGETENKDKLISLYLWQNQINMLRN